MDNSKRSLTDDILDKKKLEIEEFAKEFSEGNAILEKLLLSMWDNGIKTIACCAGHEDRESDPYIAFEVNGCSNPLIHTILSFLFKNNYIHGDVTFLFQEKSNKIRCLVVCITLTEQTKNLVFQEMLNICQNMNKEDFVVETNTVFYNAIYLSYIAKNLGLNFQYMVDIETSEMLFGFKRTGTILDYDPKHPCLLNEHMNVAENTHDLRQGVGYECDEQTLHEFLNIIYKDSGIIIGSANKNKNI